MLDDFLVRALLGGIGVAAIAGPLGCFVVWRRMAYFGNALAHSALLGIAAGVLLSIDLSMATAGVCVAFAGALVLLQHQRKLATDTLLGILAHAALALGLVALSFLETVRVDLSAYLFGDVLAIGRRDLLWIFGGGAAILLALLALWSRLLRTTISQELAQAEGVAVGAVQAAFMLLMALAVAIGMKLVGILLIVSLLIIPPATARPLARSPEQMAALAAVAGALAVALGLAGSLSFDTPAGASIVVAAAVLFFLSLGAGAAVHWLARQRSS
jgi:zinc transport system permease protein